MVFRLDRINFTKTVARFGKVNGQLVFDAATLTASRVEAQIGTSSVSTNRERRDAWIRSDKMLDADKVATITFVSNKVIVAGGNAGTVNGVLTLGGVAKPLSFAFTFGKQGPPAAGSVW